MRILVVEDDDELAESLLEFLSLHGHSTAIARNVPSAMRIVDSFRPEVVLVDIILPVFDGNLLAAEVRLRPEGSPRIIAMTSRPDLVAKPWFDDLLPKPLVPADLLKALGEGVPGPVEKSG
jgi:DNA-binding response OmpR family regulator